MNAIAQPAPANSSGANLGLWSFRFVLWYICIYLVQPQHRFTFLVPFRPANTVFLIALALYFVDCAMKKRRILQPGAATIFATVLFVMALIANTLGAYKGNPGWGAEMDTLAKNCAVVILLETLLTSTTRVYALLLTLFFSSLWWFKAGVRGIQAGGTFMADRIMGPNVGLIQGPNEFGIMMAGLAPLLMAFFFVTEGKSLVKWGFLAAAGTGLVIVLETGSRAGLLCLMLLGLLVVPRLLKMKFSGWIFVGIAVVVALNSIKEGNRERFRTLPAAIRSVMEGTPEKPYEEMNIDERSAEDRRQKDIATWGLIKANPIFGAGLDPASWRYPAQFSAASGMVHNELLMAGRQMGLPGMALLLTLYAWIIFAGWGVQRRMKRLWPEVSALAWGIKLMAVILLFGGLFSTYAWNVVLMCLLVAVSRLRAFTKPLAAG